MKPIDEKAVADLTILFDKASKAVNEFANAIITTMQPVIEAVTVVMKNPEFQAAVVKALQDKLDQTPERDVKTRIELQAQLKTWKKMMEGNEDES